MFRSAIENSRDISEGFWAHFGTDVYHTMLKSDDEILSRIRHAMGEIHTMDSIASSRNVACSLLADGRVAAVDGTNAVEPFELVTTSRVVVATAYMTRLTAGDPEITITDTSIEWDTDQPANIDLDRLLEQLDEFRSTQSWPVTFREYCERKLALDVTADTVFLDGPIATQNLLTQPEGRDLIQSLIESDKTVIGVIKDVRSSWQRCKWFARALRQGEYHLVEPLFDRLAERYKHASDLVEWTDKVLGKDICRYVYRPCMKPFAFECSAEELPKVMSLLIEDQSTALHHEIPDLLNQVDNRLRAMFYESGILAERSIAAISESDIEAGVFLTGERLFR